MMEAATQSKGLDHAVRRLQWNASEVPALFGADPFKSFGDVVASKIYDLEPDDSSEAALLGHELEDALVSIAVRRVAGEETEKQVTGARKDLNLAATADGQTLTVPALKWALIEAKTHRLASRFQKSTEEWGDTGTDEVPDRVLLQTAAQLLCFPSADLVLVPCLVPDLRIFLVMRNHDLCNIIRDKLPELWLRHVVNREPVPAQQGPTMDVLKRVRRQPNTTVAVDPEKVKKWLYAKEAAKAAIEFEEEAEAAVVNEMGDAEGGLYEGGALTYFAQKQRRLDTAKAKEMLGASAPMKEIEFRQLRTRALRPHERA